MPSLTWPPCAHAPQGKSFAGNSGSGALPPRKRRKREGLDPLKGGGGGGGGFVRAPKRGGDRE